MTENALTEIDTLPKIRLKPGRAAPFFGRHPWVLDSAIEAGHGEVLDGQVVDLYAENDNWIARGIWNSNSRIRVRLYSWEREESLDQEFWQRKIARALLLRNDVGYWTPEGACRAVYSEADGLSGLIVEKFGSYFVVQPTSFGMWQRLDTIVPIIAKLGDAKGIVVRLDDGARKREGFEAGILPTWGEIPSDPIEIVEHGLKYSIDLRHGQKTGFYLDQRENRLAVSKLVSGRRVLDMCCYTGAFSLNATKNGRALSSLGVDTSELAVEQAKANATRNGVKNCEFIQADCFEWLQSAGEVGKKFDAVILDPPKFSPGKSGTDQALRAYHRLNLSATKVLEKDGLLVTCSCTGSVSSEQFSEMLHSVSVRSKRTIQILERRGASLDHPISTSCRESEYLKCFICRVS